MSLIHLDWNRKILSLLDLLLDFHKNPRSLKKLNYLGWSMKKMKMSSIHSD